MRVVHIVIAHAQKLLIILYIIYLEGNTYILLQYWEGNTGKYTVQDRPYRPDQREGGYRGRKQNISPYCPTVEITIINLLYNFRIAIGTGNNERAIWENFTL